MAGTPRKPGWYWDPQELEYNLALRKKWRRQLLLTEHEAYRLRWWDGRGWSDETLTDYSLRRRNSIPHLLGPTTPIEPLTPAQARRNLIIWAVLMVGTTLFWVVTLIVR